jgi:hypothetical protein
MLESNPSRNSRLETHPNDEKGASVVWIGAPIVRIDFPMPSKLIKGSRREAAPLWIAAGG